MGSKLQGLKTRVKNTKTEPGRGKQGERRVFDEQLKKDIIAYHYESGMTPPNLGEALGIAQQSINQWKRKYGKQQTAFVYGKTLRHDVRTKCLAVQEVIDGGREHADVAIQYNVAVSTIGTWIHKYKNDYKEYIETLVDGVSVIAKSEKLVYGDKNIKETLAVMQDQYIELKTMMEAMQKYGIKGEALKKAKEKVKENAKAVDILKAAQEIMDKYAA